MASGTSYSRIGAIRIPVSLDSASNPFPFPDNLKGISNLHFQAVNLGPYDIRLEGTTDDQMASGGFRPVSDGTGWPIPAYKVLDPRVSKMPVFLSAKVVSTPGNPVAAGTDFTGCFLDLVYLQKV